MYLRSLVDLAPIFEAVHQLTNRLSNKSPTVPLIDLDYLEFRVSKWHEGISTTLFVSKDQLRNPHAVQNVQSAQLFRKLVLALRANQVRSLVLRPVLHTEERIMNRTVHAARHDPRAVCCFMARQRYERQHRTK